MEVIDKNNIDIAIKALQNGEIVAFPTETVFGLGVVFDNKVAYDKLIKAKRRPPEKPFTLMCADICDIEKYAYINEEGRKLINAFFPGQMTIILKAKEGLPKWVFSREGNVGIRISSDETIRSLIRRVGKPLLVPSANRSGEKPALTVAEVQNSFDDEISVIISGRTSSNVPSTVVDAVDQIRILREGVITAEEINKVIKEK